MVSLMPESIKKKTVEHMLKVVIIEQEQPAIENLLYELHNLEGQYKIVNILRSVEESVSWLNEPDSAIDLIFMDVELAHMLYCNLFKPGNIYTPVIFTASSSSSFLSGHQYNGIDYLLKPVCQDKLRQSITKFNNLKKHFTLNYQQPANVADGESHMLLKDRIIVKKGIEFQSIKAEDVAYFYTENKLIFLLDKEGKKFMAHANNLTDLMLQLNRKIFFRANRKFIININFIKKYKHFERVKVEVELSIPCAENVVISQENSGSFKNWIENL